MLILGLVGGFISGALEAEGANLLSEQAGARLVSVSSQLATSGEGSATALVDGSSSVGWSSQPQAQVPQSMVFELPSTVNLGMIVVDNRGAEIGSAGASARAFTVTASTTSATEGFQIVVFAQAEQGDRSEFAPQYAADARWIKVEVFTNWGHGSRTRISELEIYAGDGTSPTVSTGVRETVDEDDEPPDEPPEDEPQPKPEPPAESEIYWQGRIEVKIEDPGQAGDCLWQGTSTTDLTFDVLWREVRRVDVRNRKGELTGQFVVLADDGSSWVGRRQGVLWKSCAGSRTDRTESGEGSGEDTLRFGWIYYSFSDEDPLRDVLPNGAYMLFGDEGEHFRQILHDVHTSSSGTRESTSRGWTVATYRISRPNFLPATGNVPFGTTADPGAYTYSEDLVAEELVGHVAGLSVPGQDPQLRVLQGDLMTGSYSGHGFVEPRIRRQVRWRIEKTFEVDAVVEHPERSWLPTAGDEAEPVTVEARIDAPEGARGKFRFTLYDVTREPGHAMNFGEEGDDEDDLVFTEGRPGWTEPRPTEDGNGLYVETLETVRRAEVSITPKDYGGWARLKCEVVVDGREHDCETEDGKPLIVPLDHDEDRIADFWQEENDVQGLPADDDSDAEPSGQDGDGDGLSIYEEYRGLIVESYEHRRLDPHKKQLFIRDEDALVPGADFETLTGLEIVYVNDDGWSGEQPNWVWSDGNLSFLDHRFMSPDPQTRRINFKTSGYAHRVDQHALHVTAEEWGQNEDLLQRELLERQLGLLEPGDFVSGQVFGSIASPGTISRVVVFVDHVLSSVWHDMNEENVFWEDLYSDPRDLETECPHLDLYDLQESQTMAWEEINATLRHELGHAVGIQHHAPSPYGGDPTCVMRYYSFSEKMHSACPSQSSVVVVPFPSKLSDAGDGPGGKGCRQQIRISDEVR